MYLWTNVQWAAWFFQQLNVHGLRQARSWRFQRANTYTLTSTKWLNDKTRKNGNYPATRPILFEMTFCSVLWPKKHQMARFGCRGQGTTVHTVSDFMTFIPGQSVWISFFLQFRVLCSPQPPEWQVNSLQILKEKQQTGIIPGGNKRTNRFTVCRVSTS